MRRGTDIWRNFTTEQAEAGQQAFEDRERKAAVTGCGGAKGIEKLKRKTEHTFNYLVIKLQIFQ